MLSDVFPTCAMNDPVNGCRMDAKSARRLGLIKSSSGMVVSQRAHDFGRELGVAVAFTHGRLSAESRKCRRAVSALAFAVRVVVGDRAKEQMRRIATRWRVARMAHAHRCWDCAACQLVSNSVSGQGSVSAILPARGDSIALAAERTAPRPAVTVRAADDVRPESLFKRFAHLVNFTMRSAWVDA